MSKNIFIDANIILDFFDTTRLAHNYSKFFYKYVLDNDYNLFTSCDLITTIYYINAKKNKAQALLNIRDINKTLKVIEFSNKEVEQTCELMIEDSDYKDLEDTMQYILAKKFKCDMIITNDKNFTSKDIMMKSSEEFCNQMNIKEIM